MNKETTNPEVNGNQEANEEANAEQFAELVKAVHHNGLTALRMHFDNVEGQVLNQEVFGPVFVYQVKDASNNGYVCGFFLHELITQFQHGSNPAQWMASFFVDMMKTEGGRLLPKPPANEDEAKAMIDKYLVPRCIDAINEEFGPDQVHAGLGFHQEHGPVFEAGFPSIVNGNNVCAFPINLLATLVLMNRDPSDLVLQALYKIKDEHEAAQQTSKS
ncbi:hypothetical protein [Paenibacillus xylaniclasticus]|uniref:hypothetical protein n=1 Tax=Paenibacillus xylaniclasticus TaxID=588083 RepID=UPI000FD9337C|nr:MULTISPECIES: hypothetical protein [Paenibacillus]